jgi:outer membrane protein TolC
MSRDSRPRGARVRFLPADPRFLLLCVASFAACAFLAACASPKATRQSPELPPRHWLGESPGVPVRSEKGEEVRDTVPLTLYQPEKTYNFEDCVYLAVQQSPLLVKSSIKLEMSRLKEKDAAWQYLPEGHVVLSSAANLTLYNQGNSYNYGDYGRTKFQVRFYAAFPNPIGTYLTNRARQIMTNVAVLTHRKAIGEAIWEIADNYLQLRTQKRIQAELAKLPAIVGESTTYWKAMDAGVGGHTLDVEMAAQNEKQVVLERDKSTHMEIMVRTRLKTLLGLGAEQRLNADPGDGESIFRDFDVRKLSWEERWELDRDYLAEKLNIKLRDYNIMLAWAQYMPTISFDVNTYPPAGQAQPYGGRDDYFLHLNFDFLVLDWGRRYRAVQDARMEKALAFQSMVEKRTQYANEWAQNEQAYAMSRTNAELAGSNLRSAELQAQKAEIEYKGGDLPLPELTARREAVVKARMALIEAELKQRQAELAWMHQAGLLEERFMDLPEKSLQYDFDL